MTRAERETELFGFNRKYLLHEWRRVLGHSAEKLPRIGVFSGQLIIEILNAEFPALILPGGSATQ